MTEKDGCGVGLLISLKNKSDHSLLMHALSALERVEHRGGVGIDNIIGDGAGIMTNIPYELYNRLPEKFAVANMFIPKDSEKQKISLRVFEETFQQFGLEVSSYRDVPIDNNAISPLALKSLPALKQAIIERPSHCRTLQSFEKILYDAKQLSRTKQKENGIIKEFFFASLSPRTIIYKALSTSISLKNFYLDFRNPLFKVSFAIFHRRFSTNTLSSWDKVQPFRMIAHNGEINTIEGNRAWGITREVALGLRPDELLTHNAVSDSGTLNDIAEALKFRSSIPQISEIMAILIPPADKISSFYKFWGRGMEAWDGPALTAFCDGKVLGARLDRNGFRPCRWSQTEDHFYLSSEAGAFTLDEAKILKKGALSSGESVTIGLHTGSISFLDPEDIPENKNAFFESNLIPLIYMIPPKKSPNYFHQLGLFAYSKEEIDKHIISKVINISSAIGSMGDTACLPFLSKKSRSLFDFFYQDFAQVTNPPLDYIREKLVTDMRVFIGRKPNIFEPKEFIPPKASFEVKGPLISLGQIEFLKNLNEVEYPDLKSYCIDITMGDNYNLVAFNQKCSDIEAEAVWAIKRGKTIIILSDTNANENNLPMPILLALTTVNLALNKTGRRLRTSLVLETGEAKNSHHVACLLAYGATAVCPHLTLKSAIYSEDPRLDNLFPMEREKRIIRGMAKGILRIIAKMGISVLRSYQGSKLFTPLGLDQEIHNRFFPNTKSIIGGLSLVQLLEKMNTHIEQTKSKPIYSSKDIKPNFIYKEHAGGKLGETHSMTSARAKKIHQILKNDDQNESWLQFNKWEEELEISPLLIRHLLAPSISSKKLILNKVEATASILKRFGSGAMSFGAISAESQRDLIKAFNKIGGHSNSGEGGENPYYDIEGFTSHIKQIASGRFGVTAEYLVTGHEIQIKIAQGAKPGEGGQLMGVKVTKDIAKARFSSPGVELISPPPQHDIYSIEDLKELIYELKSLSPKVKVSVKLVSGKNIGAIAMGVVKAGADIIQISGGDGGTGAASLISMKHAGLPLEIGLWEVHSTLLSNDLRNKVRLRADGNLLSGKDIVIAAILGADQFDFGKLLLISEGCIMARICEKNTCPTGIATHDPKFKEKYKGRVEHVVKLLEFLAASVKIQLQQMGARSVQEIIGQTHYLQYAKKHLIQANEINFDLSYFEFNSQKKYTPDQPVDFTPSKLNHAVIENLTSPTAFKIINTDRAVPATLIGLYAQNKAYNKILDNSHLQYSPSLPTALHIQFTGSAGQGFGVFNCEPLTLTLKGEANDSVAKGMSGGKVLILPPERANYPAEENSIIGNCALYGATGGKLFVHGTGGDRFAVRNSGAHTIIEAVGMHACEYMSGGLVWILNDLKKNLGAGMTGGVVYLPKRCQNLTNQQFLSEVPLLKRDIETLYALAKEYVADTGSKKLQQIINKNNIEELYCKFIPKSLYSKILKK